MPVNSAIPHCDESPQSRLASGTMINIPSHGENPPPAKRCCGQMSTTADTARYNEHREQWGYSETHHVHLFPNHGVTVFEAFRNRCIFGISSRDTTAMP